MHGTSKYMFITNSKQSIWFWEVRVRSSAVSCKVQVIWNTSRFKEGKWPELKRNYLRLHANNMQQYCLCCILWVSNIRLSNTILEMGTNSTEINSLIRNSTSIHKSFFSKPTIISSIVLYRYIKSSCETLKTYFGFNCLVARKVFEKIAI